MTSEFLFFEQFQYVYAALTPPNRLVCEVCVSTGLRLGDVLAFETAKLGPQFWITEQKTGKRRRVNLRYDLLKRLLAQAGDIWVFEGARDKKKHRTRQAVWYDLKRAAAAFRLPQNVSPHSLRKMFAVNELEKSKGNMKKVQKLLNHSDLATTMVYVMAKQIYDSKYGEGTGLKKRRRKRAS